MKKKRNAFTLIELLAVIVVLAIIALIATPIVMNTIKKSKKGAAERSAENYIDAVETAVATERLNGNVMEDGEYEVTSDGNLCKDKSASCSDENKIKIEMNGTKPKSGSIIIKDNQVDTSSTMIIGDYTVMYNLELGKYEALKNYINGETVYFNVTTGEKCTDYTESQSNTGVKSGCMKFYAFNDDGKNTINLLLDHNTTSRVYWNSSRVNESGPSELLTQLQTDTSSWKGTITPSNYTMDQTGQTSNAKYTIDYSGYKARLITAQEIATITGNTGWDEKNTDSVFYFDTNMRTSSSTCTSGNTSGCSYGWLYDRITTNCELYGCLNNADAQQNGFGFWTVSARVGNSITAWTSDRYGRLSSDYVYFNYYGVRPVIEVLKSQLG